MTDPTPTQSLRAARIIVIGLAVTAAFFLLGGPLVHQVAVIACGGLIGVVIGTLAKGLGALRIPYRPAVGVVVVGSIAAIAALAIWVGPTLFEQLEDLESSVRQGISTMRGWLQSTTLGRALATRLEPGNGGSMGAGDLFVSVTAGVQSGLSMLTDLAIVLLLGVMLALTPQIYIEGTLRLIQFVESSVLSPLVEARAIRLPPALVLIAQVIAAAWLGPLGIVLSTPLLVLVVEHPHRDDLEDHLGER